jgi:hypothetical protein
MTEKKPVIKEIPFITQPVDFSIIFVLVRKIALKPQHNVVIPCLTHNNNFGIFCGQHRISSLAFLDFICRPIER